VSKASRIALFLVVAVALLFAGAAGLGSLAESFAALQASGSTIGAYSAPVSDISDPRVVSVIVLLAILSASAAISSGASAILLRKRISSQHIELQSKVAQLEALEARQDAVLKTLPDLIFLYDKDGRYKDFLESDGRSFAVSPDAFIGKTVLEVFGDEELYRDTMSAIQDTLAGRGPRVFEYVLKDVAPDEHWEARFVKLTDDTVMSLSRDVTERHRAEEQRDASLLEKEALLKEIHHRVKNNMQIVSSLLSMQSARARDPYDQELFIDSQNRIRAMASVHDQLYRSKDFTSIPAGEYLSDLVSGLESSWTRPDRWIRAAVEADDTALELDLAVPIGLIVNELVTNSFKYAFGAGSSGTILVRVSGWKDGGVRVSVRDDGAGLPSGFDARKGDGGMGYTIINALVMQIRGDIDLLEPEGGGAEIVVTAPPLKKAQP